MFRIFLLICFAAIASYTAITIGNHGADLLPVFFGDMAKMGWAGQFNLDFMTFLALSGLWVAWRHQFSAAGLALGVIAFFAGMFFLSLYLLFHSVRTGGDNRALLLGEARAKA